MAKKLTAATRVIQSSSNEVSIPVPDNAKGQQTKLIRNAL